MYKVMRRLWCRLLKGYVPPVGNKITHCLYNLTMMANENILHRRTFFETILFPVLHCEYFCYIYLYVCMYICV